MYRDITMKEISEQHIGQTLQVAGWVENIRDHGGVSFIDLRHIAGGHERHDTLGGHHQRDVHIHRGAGGKA